MKILISLCLLLTTGQVLAASSCPDIRLDQAGALASVPVFDQATATASTDMNICYAATAAQLIDTYRASTKKAETPARSEVTSPWWVAVNYASAFKTEDNPDVQFGEPDKALEAMKSDGTCSQEDLFGKKPTDEIIHFHQMLKEFYRSVASQKEEEKTLSQKLGSILDKVDFIKDPALVTEVSLKAIHEKTFVKFLRTLFQAKCQGKVKTNAPYEVERIEADRLNLSNDRKEELIVQTLKRSQPIEVSICSQVLRNPEYVPEEDYKKCMRHSAMVVGSREKNGQCQYLVRDTYGTESCQRKRNGQPWYHPSLECSSGQVWVPGKALLSNTWGMTRVMAIATPPATTPTTPIGIAPANAAATASSTTRTAKSVPAEAESLKQ